jgi:pyruvate/2-oxoglutarate dehydrogenase complex dihydrolipoamide acyltransferase (E2) component
MSAARVAAAIAPAAIARERRHTLYFLEETRATVPVFLDTEVDMTRVKEYRGESAASCRRRSTVACVVYAASRALALHPAANAAISGRRFPRVARYDRVNTKLTLDKTLNGARIVLSAVLPETDRADLGAIQERISGLREADPATAPEFGGARVLHRLGWPLGPILLRRGARPLARRAAVTGTLAVTSLGHRPVDGFLSVGGTVITLGLGQVAERPVVRDGMLAVAPVMRLSLTFDHRVIDGAEAADLLTDIKSELEDFTPADESGQDAPVLTSAKEAHR